MSSGFWNDLSPTIYMFIETPFKFVKTYINDHNELEAGDTLKQEIKSARVRPIKWPLRIIVYEQDSTQGPHLTYICPRQIKFIISINSYVFNDEIHVSTVGIYVAYTFS